MTVQSKETEIRAILPNLLPDLWLPHLPRLKLPPIGRWRRIARERRQLAGLSDYMLQDIGITRADAEHEAARPFWDAPR